ncbi:MAG TPA: hypothetical protein VGH89_28095 [Pseudonocardia sp.]
MDATCPPSLDTLPATEVNTDGTHDPIGVDTVNNVATTANTAAGTAARCRADNHTPNPLKINKPAIKPISNHLHTTRTARRFSLREHETRSLAGRRIVRAASVRATLS